MAYNFPDGTPIWVDLSTTDLDGAKEFYRQVLGWESNEQTDTDGNVIYHMFTQGGKIAAGVMSSANGTPSAWTTYFQTTNIGETVEAAKAAGGSVMVEPMQVMDGGHMALIADDQGAVFGLWQPGTHKGADEYIKPGFYGWNELATHDMTRAKAFYGAVFGWMSEDTDMTGDGTMYTSFMIDGKTDVHDNFVGGGMAITPEMGDTAPNWSAYFSVADIDAAVENVQEAGGTVVVDKMDIPETGQVVGVTDPQGAFLYLIQPSFDL